MSVTDELLANATTYAASFDKGSLPLPPAKLKLVGARSQPSPERVNTAGWRSTNGRRSIWPRPVSRMLSGVTLASVVKSNAAPRRPAIAARTWPLPLTSRALAVSRARLIPLASKPRASTGRAPGRSSGT